MKHKTVKFCESFENCCILHAPVATPTHTGQSAVSAASGPHPRATAPPPILSVHINKYVPTYNIDYQILALIINICSLSLCPYLLSSVSP